MRDEKIMTSICDSAPSKWRLPLALLLIAGITVAVYWTVLHNGFIDFDDEDYVTLNMVVRQGITLKGFIWSFTSFHAANWHPLTWLSHMLDVELFGLNPMGHHATSLLLHTVNAALLCALLYRLTGYLGRSVVVALLFAVHPLHVESVAWVAERKDVLSTLFWFLTIWAYGWYTRCPSLKRYLSVVLLFVLGLMAKQMLVTLPIVMLLLDYWPLSRLFAGQTESQAKHGSSTRLLIEKVPFFLISAAAALITIRAQESGGAVAHGDGQSLLLSAGNAFISYGTYIRNMLWPTDLALFYPFEPSAVTVVKVAASMIILALLTGLTATQWKKRPYLLFGWSWYLVTLLPVIGFIRVGGQALADRYTYIPLIGLFVMIVWGVAETASSWSKGIPTAAGIATVVLVVLSLLTVSQIRYWQNSYDLFSHALAVVDRNWLAHNNMGILLSQHNRNDEALLHFQESVRLNPNGVEGFRNLGNSLQMAGRSAEAVEAYRQALRINPGDVEAHMRLGYAYLLGGNSESAYQEYLQLQHLDEARAHALLDSIRSFGKR
ncbi:MAG: tetratricopeptide repeat protein [Desulfuromonadaceae bacterium]|nr:tetratricopeptide repeat protein [Desulfuromonadaceae bacterium]MDD5106927.1 tetratricopeptide repeat protein [Desulfuromonadaceae bacterium]